MRVVGRAWHDPAAAAVDAGDSGAADAVAVASVEACGFCRTHAWAATGGTDGRLVVWDIAGSAVTARGADRFWPDLTARTDPACR